MVSRRMGSHLAEKSFNLLRKHKLLVSLFSIFNVVLYFVFLHFGPALGFWGGWWVFYFGGAQLITSLFCVYFPIASLRALFTLHTIFILFYPPLVFLYFLYTTSLVNDFHNYTNKIKFFLHKLPQIILWILFVTIIVYFLSYYGFSSEPQFKDVGIFGISIVWFFLTFYVVPLILDKNLSIFASVVVSIKTVFESISGVISGLLYIRLFSLILKIIISPIFGVTYYLVRYYYPGYGFAVFISYAVFPIVDGITIAADLTFAWLMYQHIVKKK